MEERIKLRLERINKQALKTVWVNGYWRSKPKPIPMAVYQQLMIFGEQKELAATNS